MENNKYFITTPIYYVNDVPHIGHSYTTIAADTLARYKRFKGYDVFFLTGTDEHGQKIEKTAKNIHKTPKELADAVVVNFQNLWKTLNINNDFFIRTTDKTHKDYVASAFVKLYKKGDIYKGEYEGWYCVPCETYYSDLEIKEDCLCPSCAREVEKVREESYFFKLSKYENKLLSFYQINPDFVIPPTRYNEIKSFVKSGLRDLSITRISFDWGVKVPFDTKHVIYVWFDALLNYISALNYPENAKFKDHWPANAHFVGKDILRFHAVYWPAFLMALGFSLPKHVVAHGWWTIEKKKMSKSLGNVIDPNEMIKKYPKDAYRYFLLRNVPFGSDGDFSEKELIERINSELANDLGNLVNRSLTMAENYFNNIINKPSITDNKLKELSQKTFDSIELHLLKFRFDEALVSIFEFIRAINKYITEKEPWVLKKENKDKALINVMYNVMCGIKAIAGMISPFMPDTSENILKQLGLEQYTENLNYNDFKDFYSEKTYKIRKSKILFSKIEKEKQAHKEKIEKHERRITVDKFLTIDLRVAKILNVETITKSEKLLKLSIDIGEEKPRTLVAGLKKFFSPNELIGKYIIVVANLQPTKLMGIESNGMLLAAKDGADVKLLTIDGIVKPGSKIS